MIATDEVRRLKMESRFETLVTPWTNEDEAEDIAFNTVWNSKCCNLGFVAGRGAEFFKLAEERILIQSSLKSKAQKTGEITAARQVAKSEQPLKVGDSGKRAVEKVTPVSKPKKSKLEPVSKATDTILEVNASFASESAVIAT